jgi:hypothetical protein
MSISVFPTPAAEDTSVNNLKYNVVAANSSNLYKGPQALKPGIYTISCTSTTNTTVAFWNGSTEILSATTVSGTISVNLPNGATSFYYNINTGTSISIDIQRVANAVAYAAAVVDILTSSASYTHTGKAYVVAVGGGEGGQSGPFPAGNTGFSGYSGRGGKSGGIATGLLTLSGTVNYTVGAAGNSNGAGSSEPNAGGNSTFSNVATSANVGQGNGGAAADNSGNGGNGNAGTTSAYTFVVTGTTGGGGGGTRSGGTNGGNGAGSGIGTGGNGGRPISDSPVSQNNGNNASGYGGGGGGAGANAGGGGNASGGNGGPGVIYVLKLPQ